MQRILSRYSLPRDLIKYGHGLKLARRLFADKETKKGDEKGKSMIEEKKLVPRKVSQPLSAVKVAVVGAASPIGSCLSMLLKINKYVKEIAMFDVDPIVRGIGVDLKAVPTKTSISTVSGLNYMRHALYKAEIVVICGGSESLPGLTTQEVFQSNAEYLYEVAQVCARVCPEAIFIIAMDPINANVPLFGSVLEQNGLFCPNRVLGTMCLSVMQAQGLLASLLDLDPRSVRVHIIGGASPETMVPIILGTEPGGSLVKPEDAVRLTKKIRNMSEDLRIKMCGESPQLSGSHAINKLITTVSKELCGKKTHEQASIYFRNSSIKGIKYLAVPVSFGYSGIEKNHGVPRLQDFEQRQLEEALIQLKKDAKLGEQYVDDPCSFTKKKDRRLPPVCISY